MAVPSQQSSLNCTKTIGSRQNIRNEYAALFRPCQFILIFQLRLIETTRGMHDRGIGGVGGLLAGELLRAGAELTLVTGNPIITAAINRNGIAIPTPDDSFQVAASASTALTDLPPEQSFDCAYLAMMAGDVVDAARAALPLLKDNAYFVAFQNGFIEEAIGNAVGNERVISATVALGSSMEAPGMYRRTTAGRIIIGEMDGRRSQRLDRLRSTLSHVVDTEISRTIVGVLWGKLVWNGAVSCLCAISGKLLGELFDLRSDVNCFS